MIRLITIVFLILPSISFCGCLPLLYPGIGKDGTAKILVDDSKFGRRALWKAKLHGDAFLDPLRKASKNFELLGTRNSRWIAELLAFNCSERSNDLLLELLHRETDYPALAGAIGLAVQGKSSDRAKGPEAPNREDPMRVSVYLHS